MTTDKQLVQACEKSIKTCTRLLNDENLLGFCAAMDALRTRTACRCAVDAAKREHRN